MSETIPENFLDLFQKKSLAYLSVHLRGEDMMVNPVWCGWDGENVVLNSVEGRLKDKMMREHRRVAMCIADPDNSFRYLDVRGTVIEITTDGADEHIDQLSQRYLGMDKYPYRRPGDVRVIFRIRPDKVRGAG
jgi:PPOX class probable F420-dependent enzyme